MLKYNQIVNLIYIMTKKIFLILVISFFSVNSYSQNRFVAGGRLGLSVAGGVETSPGFQIGPMGEYFFNPSNTDMALGTELNINTQAGVPVEWANYFKYFIMINRIDMKPYVDGGLSLWFYTGGPSLALRFGGGINFLVAPNIYIPADIQIGPIFATGSSVFYFALTTGIRYELP
jgi:hypothetical protein